MKKVLAFDIGGTNTRLALINENFEIEKELVTSTPCGDKKKFVENCVKMVEKFPLENVVSIGAGVPGLVDEEKGTIISLVNVGINDIEFAKVFKEKFNLNLYLRNDAQVACLGEAYLGAGKDYERVFFITISTGLGSALCVDSKIDDHVTEVGHTLFNYKNNIIEYETISGANIKKFAKLNNLKINTAKDMFDGVRNNDKNSLIFFNEWVNVFNQYISLMNNSYSPDVILITGGLTKAKDLYFEKLQNNLKEIPILECGFKENAGLIGAGVYAFQQSKIIWFII